MRKPRAGSFLIDPLQYVNDPAVLALNSAEMGAFTRIFMRSWSMHDPGVIEPATDVVLSGLAQMEPREWRKARTAVSACFDTSEPGRWIQKGLRRTHETQNQFIARQSEKGRRGAEKRWATDGRGIATPSETGVKKNGRGIATGGYSLLGSRFSVLGEDSSCDSSASSVSPAFTGEVKGYAPAARSLRAKPTLAELESYLRERRSLGKPRVDAEAFMAHYESNGWRVGRHPMKNWRAAVVTWEKNGLSVFRRTANNGKVTAEQLGEFNRQWREREERNGKA